MVTSTRSRSVVHDLTAARSSRKEPSLPEPLVKRDLGLPDGLPRLNVGGESGIDVEFFDRLAADVPPNVHIPTARVDLLEPYESHRERAVAVNILSSSNRRGDQLDIGALHLVASASLDEPLR